MRRASSASSSRPMSGYTLMSRRYWSNEPSSYDDFLLRLVTAIRMAAPESGEHPVTRGLTRGQVASRNIARCGTATANSETTALSRLSSVVGDWLGQLQLALPTAG